MNSRALIVLGGAFLLASPTLAHAAPAGVVSARTASALSGAALPRSLAESSYNRGRADLKAGKYVAAIADFQAAVKQHDHVADAYEGLGQALLLNKQYAKSYKAFAKAAQLVPRNAPFVYHAAYSALYSADYTDAIQWATRYIALEPRDPAGYHLRFLAYGNMLDKKHQIQDARKVAQLEPHSASANNDLGIALANNKQYKQSIAAFTTAIRLQPKTALFYANRGNAEGQIKEYRAALNDFRRARALTSDAAQKRQYDTVIAYLQKKLHH